MKTKFSSGRLHGSKKIFNFFWKMTFNDIIILIIRVLKIT